MDVTAFSVNAEQGLQGRLSPFGFSPHARFRDPIYVVKEDPAGKEGSEEKRDAPAPLQVR